jgi:hypothetical protein
VELVIGRAVMWYRGSRVAEETLLGRSVGAAFNSTATPAGRKLTAHAMESLARHGYKSLDKVDDVIANTTMRAEQADGALVYIQQVGKGSKATFNVVVEGSEGITTGFANLSRKALEQLGENYRWVTTF